MSQDQEDLRYPIGRPDLEAPVTPQDRAAMIKVLDELPLTLREAVDGLTDAQLDTPYRPGGWTVRQLVHHLPDSHANAYLRFKLALTEDAPTILTYDEKAWAELDEARTGPVGMSLILLEGLHRRWVASLRTLPEEAWDRTLVYPGGRTLTVAKLLTIYAWHSLHHVAHITRLREREGW